MKTAISKARKCAIGQNAIDAGTKRRIRTQTMWLVKGWIRGAFEIHEVERRISAANKDAAIAKAHARGMSVRECVCIPSTRK